MTCFIAVVQNWTDSISDVCQYNILIPWVVFSGCLLKQKYFNFDEIQFNTFAVAACTFGVKSKRRLPNPKSQKFTPVFSSRRFIVSSPIFRSMTHSELIFCAGVGVPTSFFSMWIYSCPVTIAKDYYFPIVLSCCSWKSIDKCKGLKQRSQFCSTDLCLYCLDCLSFVVGWNC